MLSNNQEVVKRHLEKGRKDEIEIRKLMLFIIIWNKNEYNKRENKREY